MANIQRQLLAFHEGIKLDNFDENAVLREKRDILLDRVRANIARDFAERSARVPSFTLHNQGSYAMGTGVKPVDNDYDIDVGLFFNIRASEHNPVDVKRWVERALHGHKVELRRPCVTVWHQRQGEPIYHVDFAIYSSAEMNPDQRTRLAMGFVGSEAATQVWELADPVGLVEKVNNRWVGPNQGQFRRVVRYLKRWADERFSSRGIGAPVGIGLTIAALEGFRPTRGYGEGADHDDLAATRAMADWLIGRFQSVYTGSGFAERLVVKTPVAPHDNPFERISNIKMMDLKQKLIELRAALDEASQSVDPARALAALRPHFGASLPQ